MLVAFCAGLLICTVSSAQSQKGSNHLTFVVAAQNYRDANGAKHEGYADRNSYAANTWGHYLGIDYIRHTRYGFIYGAGVQYGIRNYSAGISYNRDDFDRFDPAATLYVSLEKYGASRGAKHRYCAPHLFIGYRHAVKKNWSVVTRIGIADKFFLFRNSDSSFNHLKGEYAYNTDDTKGKSVPLYTIDWKTEHPEANKKFRFPVIMPTFQYYIGIERTINKYMIRALNIGLEGTRGLHKWGKYPIAEIQTTANVNQVLTTKSTFSDRNISIGLRMSLEIGRNLITAKNHKDIVAQ